MIVVMSISATAEQIKQVTDTIESYELKTLAIPGGERTAIGIPSAIKPELREPLALQLGGLPGVDHITHVSRPYKLASREFHKASTEFNIKGVVFGGKQIQVMTGPCAIENLEQMRESAKAAKQAGARILRGGAFKPRSSPYSFQGLGEDGLKIIKEVGEKFGLLTITEVMQPDYVELVAKYVDILQIGARNMQNFPLLIEAGRSGVPIMLKRGPSASIDEFLLASEYLLHNNNPNVLLCERGMHPIDRTYTRNTLDLSSIPVLKEISHLPIVSDPSHGTGVNRYIAPMAMASVAAGADALMIEMHPNPRAALSDGPQSLTPQQFIDLMTQLKKIAEVIGRTV